MTIDEKVKKLEQEWDALQNSLGDDFSYIKEIEKGHPALIKFEDLRTQLIRVLMDYVEELKKDE